MVRVTEAPAACARHARVKRQSRELASSNGKKPAAAAVWEGGCRRDRSCVLPNGHVAPCKLVRVAWGLAVARAGLVHVPINPLLKRAQVAHILADSGAVMLIATPSRLKSLEEGDVPPDCAQLEEGAALEV